MTTCRPQTVQKFSVTKAQARYKNYKTHAHACLTTNYSSTATVYRLATHSRPAEHYHHTYSELDRILYSSYSCSRRTSLPHAFVCRIEFDKQRGKQSLETFFASHRATGKRHTSIRHMLRVRWDRSRWVLTNTNLSSKFGRLLLFSPAANGRAHTGEGVSTDSIG